jgi:hypothetical protein
MWAAQWEIGCERQGHSITELDALLDDLHAKCESTQPILVAVKSINGDTLTIGLGNGLSLLSFIPHNAEPPYLSSSGNRQAQGMSIFYYMGEWTEIPKRKLIPLAVARQAMRSFIATSTLPDDLIWEED